MARIYLMCGRYEEAIDELDHLLSIESGWTTNDYKLDEELKPLRDNPRFQAMLVKYTPAGGY